MSASGRIRLAAGAYTAEITPVGAALCSLQHRGRPLVVSQDDRVPFPAFRGTVLVPWPNRIGDGRYSFDGQSHQLPVNEIERNTALHGLALCEEWTLLSASPEAVSLGYQLWPRPGYPFRLSVTASYRLAAEGGLRLEVSATNSGDWTAPYGTSMHPYFAPDHQPLDGWGLQLPADSVLRVDDRLLPIGPAEVSAEGLDFRAGEAIGARVIDHAFTELRFAADGRAAARLLGGDGYGVLLEWDRACQWLQVYTLDAPGHRMHRRAVAIEPMTCAPDAFRTGAGLIRLEPGQQHTVAWQLSAATPDSAG